MRFKEYFNVGEVFTYFFRKKDPNRKTNRSVKAMHWSNRISVAMLLIAIVIMVIRCAVR